MPQAPRSASAVEARAVASLLPYAGNARTHSDEQVAQIAASILEFGFVAPVLVDKRGEIIAGHGRLLAGLDEAATCLATAPLPARQLPAAPIRLPATRQVLCRSRTQPTPSRSRRPRPSHGSATSGSSAGTTSSVATARTAPRSRASWPPIGSSGRSHASCCGAAIIVGRMCRRSTRAQVHDRPVAGRAGPGDVVADQISTGGDEVSATVHGTQKPVECMRRPMLSNSAPGDAVYERFCGSGSTIIAAEATGWICYAMDIDPSYVDVAVQRWQAFIGRVAVLAGKDRVLDDVAATPGLWTAV